MGGGGGGLKKNGKKKENGGIDLRQQGLEGFQGCSRCCYPRKVVPVNDHVWTVGVFPVASF